jgi:hypothetical protein
MTMHFDIGQVAKALLGPPNAHLSDDKLWRYGTHGSLSVDLTKNVWHDHETNRGGGVLDLIIRERGGDRAEALRWLNHRFGASYRDGMDFTKINGATHRQSSQIVDTYDYVDELGTTAFQVVRYEPKDFRQRRPDGDGGWIWNLDGVRRVLYRLPELIEAIASDRVVFVVEGEKDVGRLCKLNIVATTCPGGANKWRPEYNQFFAGADVVVIADADEPGRKHAKSVATQLSVVAKLVRLIELPAKDVSDWLEAGGTAEELWFLVEKTSEWKQANTSNNSDSAIPWWRKGLMTARDLCDQRFPEIRYVIPGLIPEGVTLLASRPKIGKSWMLLQIGTAVAGGTVTLVPSDQPPTGDVLYLALEDNPRRLQRRLTKYFGSNKENWPKRLTIVTKWKRLDQGGLEGIRDWCKSADKPELVIIDTLKKVRAPKQRGQSDYDADYEACEGLQVLAGEYGLAVIVAHHDRKMDAEDVFDTVSGTLGLTGGVDTIAIIKRRPQGITLHIEGRDLVETIEKAVTFDRETCRWMILGNADEIHQSDQRARVLAALASAADGLSTSEIISLAGLVSRTAADKLLLRMVDDGQIHRIKRGFFSLPAATRSPRPATPGEKGEKGRSEPKSLKEQGDNDQSPYRPHLPRCLEAGRSTDPSHPGDITDRASDGRASDAARASS